MLLHIDMDRIKEITMSDIRKTLTRLKTICCALLAGTVLSAPVYAGPIEIVYVGTWSGTGSGNPTGVGGPGVSSGQKYVVRINYDDTSLVTNNVDVLNAAFAPSGNSMSTIDLTAPGNSLDIFVPMEGLDAGSPFIYSQDEGDHFPAFIPAPTLNFINGSSIADPNNVIGLEYEGNFAAGAGFNIIELFNTSPGGATVNMQSQILNCGDAGCFGSSVAATGTNSLANALDLVIDAGPDIVYNAATLTQTATASITQSNDLGAGRADGEDFIDMVWSPTGTVTGNSNQVGIAGSGLTMTTSTTTWTANAVEQMTGKTSSDNTNVSYANAMPTINATATANGSDVDFTMSSIDADLAVNTLIAGFEMLSFTALVNGAIDASAFFADLFAFGNLTASVADLIAQFGTGTHNVLFSVTDKAGSSAQTSISFDANGVVKPPSIPEPSVLLLFCLGLFLLKRHQH